MSRIRSRRLVVALAALVTGVALLGVPSSSADPFPGLDDINSSDISAAGQGVASLSQRAIVRRARAQITIGPDQPMFAVIYPTLKNTPGVNGGPPTFLALCQRGRPCVANPFEQPACATDDISTQRRGPYLRALATPVGARSGNPRDTKGLDVGLYAVAKMRLLTFGFVPAEATVELRAPMEKGRPMPLTVHIWSVQALSAANGCDPDFRGADIDTYVEGQLEIKVRSLTIDGKPVDVGDRCRTVRPTPLRLWGEKGYAPGGGGDLAAYDGLHKGSLDSIGPLDSPYYRELFASLPDGSSLQGRRIPASTGLDIPAFTGCRSKDGDDISALVTATSSGPNNPLRITQSPPALRDGPINPSDLGEPSSDGRDPIKLAPQVPPAPPLPVD